jgi:hypothetical protein
LYTSENRSERPGKVLSVVLEKNGEDQLDRSCENCEVLHRVKEERNVLRTIKRRTANRIGHFLRRNCLLKHIVEEKIERIEVTGRQGRRRKQILYDLKETRECWKLKEEALDRTVW